MQKARSVIPNMCWYLAKALLPIGKKTRAIESVPLARRVSARTPSTTEIPREDNGTRDGRMDSHGHPNGDPTPMRKGRPSGRPFFNFRTVSSCKANALSGLGLRYRALHSDRMLSTRPCDKPRLDLPPGQLNGPALPRGERHGYT